MMENCQNNKTSGFKGMAKNIFKDGHIPPSWIKP